MTEPSTSLPPTMKALFYEAPQQGLTLKTIPTPQAGPGSVVVNILVAAAEPNMLYLTTAEKPYMKFPTPFVPGTRAIGRVAAVGPDAVSLKLNQLVSIEPYIRGRDNPDVEILWGLFQGATPQANKLMQHWLYAAYAEYARVPLENCIALNEEVLCGQRGYSLNDLATLSPHMVPYGGLREMDIKAGETVLVAPATGGFSGAAVAMASAMGARVVAASRNLDALKRLQAKIPRVSIVQFTGDVDKDVAAINEFGPIDAYIDISPPAAATSTHIRACLKSVRQRGRVSLMGFINADVPIPYAECMFKNLTIRGQYMYEMHHARTLNGLVESGLLKLGKEGGHEVVGEFKLEEYQKALEAASAATEYGKHVLFTP